MALMSLGRNVVLAEKAKELVVTKGMTAEAIAELEKNIEDYRKGLLETLTPWIPGDFVVSYGVLLTAWSALRGSFGWLLVVAGASALAYVVLGAFAETGFRKASDPSNGVKKGLVIRTIAGFLVSVYAAIAIPSSGWYQFKWFVDNELAVVVTAGVLVIILVLLLKGFQKRWQVSLGPKD